MDKLYRVMGYGGVCTGNGEPSERGSSGRGTRTGRELNARESKDGRRENGGGRDIESARSSRSRRSEEHGAHLLERAKARTEDAKRVCLMHTGGNRRRNQKFEQEKEREGERERCR